MHIDLAIEDRRIEFDLGYDDNFKADVCTRMFLQHNGACEPEVAHLMFRVLKEGDVAIDGGANIGFFSIMMARLVGPTGKVLVFEPGANNIPKLRDNIAMNKLENVEVIEGALWHRKDPCLHFYLCEDSGQNSVVKSEFSLSDFLVNGVTLSSYFNRERRVKLIKLDVEGSEQHALEGAYLHLGVSVPYIVCELNTQALKLVGHSQTTLRKLMLNFGYDMFVLHPEGGLPSLVPTGSAVKPLAPNTNVLFSTAKHVSAAWPVVHI